MRFRRLKIQYTKDIVLYSILYLFFFQLLSDFIEAIYAFGLLRTGLPVEMASVLFLFSPVLFIIFRKFLSGHLLVFVGEMMLLCRILEVALDTRGRMMIAGLGVSCFMLLFPSILCQNADDESELSGLTHGAGLTIALALSILLRTLNSGIDISSHNWFQAIGWMLALIAGILLVGLKRRNSGTQSKKIIIPKGDTRINSPCKTWKITGISQGLAAVYLLLYFVFTTPNVIARWTEANYLLIVTVMMLVLCLFSSMFTEKKPLIVFLTSKNILIWNCLFVLALVATILMHQMNFPSESSAYPLFAPSVTKLHYVPLIFTLLLFPIILIDFILFSGEIAARQPTSRIVGGSLTLASFFILLMIFAQIFTSVYDYIPFVGAFFRDKFWFVFLSAGIALTLPVLLIKQNSFNYKYSLSKLQISTSFPVIILLISFITITGALLSSPNPIPQQNGRKSLKILTYNIQQGYDINGLKNHVGQLDLIRGINADVIGLQETDSNRISGGNSDVVRYFADKLNLYSYYGPKTVLGTFGIAMLSKFPIENPRTFYMYSKGEQTATIAAEINVGKKIFNIFVTHLGNGGPVVQQEAILTELEGMENVIALGDFNFRPDSKQYKLTTEFLMDSWLVKWPQGVDNHGANPIDRIDHIFVSPGTNVTDSRYLINTQSDHPAVSIQIEW